MPAARSILIVSQHTPPSTLVGARRPAALAKYLTRLGHRVAVITSPASGAGPVPYASPTVRTRDLLTTPLNWRRGSLEAQQGSAAGNYQSASWLEKLVVPDVSAFSWLPSALAGANGRARDAHFDCVITTGPPQSSHLVGLALQRRGVAWVADLRDGWGFEPPRARWAHPMLAAVDRGLERLALGRADRVVTVTDPITHDLRDRLGIAATTITNGFDPEELRPADGALLDPGRFTLLHTGRLMATGDTPRTLLDAAAELARRRPGADRPLEVVFAGPMAQADERLVTAARYSSVARSVGLLERPRALALQGAADALVVMAAGMPGRGSTSVATGKLFEYLGAGRPILVLGDRTEAARIVARVGAGASAPADDAQAVASAMEIVLDERFEPAAEAVAAFSWPALAESYERVIEEARVARDRA